MDPDHFSISPSGYSMPQGEACLKPGDFTRFSLGPVESASLVQFSGSSQHRDCAPWTSLDFVHKVDSSENSARMVKRSQSSGEEENHSFHGDYTKPECDFQMDAASTHFRDFNRAPQQPHSSPLPLANPTQATAASTAVPMRSSPLFYDLRLKSALIDSTGRAFFTDPEKLEPTDEEDFDEEDEEDEVEEGEEENDDDEDEVLISGNRSC
ncbi:unnamed protein product [Dibothriocephalus latus]|uniref:Uncharacterized protein n=1 Tax=Dibothriocephalus latus TaxID=60516 RepID=A0A3P7P319_DIBLA|nr:unnamed protein product [Dibothriocephalus latus]